MSLQRWLTLRWRCQPLRVWVYTDKITAIYSFYISFLRKFFSLSDRYFMCGLVWLQGGDKRRPGGVVGGVLNAARPTSLILKLCKTTTQHGNLCFSSWAKFFWNVVSGGELSRFNGWAVDWKNNFGDPLSLVSAFASICWKRIVWYGFWSDSSFRL